MLKQVFKMGGIFIVAAILQRLANAAALAERGYASLGGEMFVFPLVCVAGYYLTGIHLWRVREQQRQERMEKRERNRERREAYERRYEEIRRHRAA